MNDRLPDEVLLKRYRTEDASLQLLAALGRQDAREVRRRLHRLGVRVDVVHDHPYRDSEVAELSGLVTDWWYTPGQDIREVLHKTGLRYGQALDLLKPPPGQDPPRRGPRGTLPPPVPPAELRHRYLTGNESVTALALDFRTSESAVRRWLTDAGARRKSRATAVTGPLRGGERGRRAAGGTRGGGGARGRPRGGGRGRGRPATRPW
ncbi:hypothetical protein, partial [Streptomyces specialis]|uniref:hypothetical protein n=1 Tax=Streptomyces specialis TaxID=498367 RepID=UPI0038999D9F